MKGILSLVLGAGILAVAACREATEPASPGATGDVQAAGQIGNLPGTRQLADTGVTGQARQTLENIKAVLTYVGSSLERVVKCTVFLADIRDYAKMNEVYSTYFPKDPPARSTVAGSGLALGARVEIECMAMVGP